MSKDHNSPYDSPLSELLVEQAAESSQRATRLKVGQQDGDQLLDRNSPSINVKDYIFIIESNFVTKFANCC